MESDGTPVVTEKDYKRAFDKVVEAVDGIREMRGVKFQLGQTVKSRIAMTTDCATPVTILKRGKKISHLTRTTIPRAYCAQTYLPIKKAKYNVKSLLTHVHIPDPVTFYDKLQPIVY